MQGGCLCGAVRYTLSASPGEVVACHCTQCRRMSGHYEAAAPVPADAISVTGTPRWYRSSDSAERGFCAKCGSSLFWRHDGSPQVWVNAGSLDGPTGLRLAAHIFTAEKGDYYEIADSLPQYQNEGPY